MKLVALLPTTQKILFVLKQTRFHPLWEKAVVGRPVGEFTLQDLTAFQKALVWKSYVQHFRANPRKVLYMLKLAYDLVGEERPDVEVDLLVDSGTNSAIPEPLRPWPRTIWTTPNMNQLPLNLLNQLQAKNYDTVIFLYQDAIGLGWGGIEQQIAKLNIPHMLVLNGRKRLFVWDVKARQMLKKRRVIESGCLVEIVLLPLLVLASIPLALYDTLHRLWWKLINSKGENT